MKWREYKARNREGVQTKLRAVWQHRIWRTRWEDRLCSGLHTSHQAQSLAGSITSHSSIPGNKLPTHESLGDGPLVNLSRCHVRWYREGERCPREARGVCRGHCSAAGQESESSERSLLTKEMPFIQEPSEVELGALGLQLGRCR